MMQQITHYLRSHYPALAALPESPLTGMDARARVVSYPAGVSLFRTGDTCNNFLLLLDGSVRVQKLSHDGHEIVLYHVRPGDVCDITATCLLGGKCYPAEGITETPVRALLIPREEFQAMLKKTEVFRHYIYSSIDRGFSELINLLEDVAFGPMDRRLAQCLLNLADGSLVIQATHHKLAVELGTAREVISRLLKDFERRGWVKLFRGRIAICDISSLRGLITAG